MVSKLAPFTSILLAFTALADPSQPVEHLPRRRVSHRSQLTSRDNNDVRTAVNWAGAELEGDPGMFLSVAGTFTVPEIYGEAGAGVSFWVGIDGDHGCGSLLQTGVSASVGSDGQTVSYGAWYEFPGSGSAIFFSDIYVNSGDTITASVDVFSDMMSGYVTIQDLTTRMSAGQVVSFTPAVCGQAAEWIVEDYLTIIGNTNSLVPLANFGTVTFSGANAFGAGGTYPAFEASLINIAQDNQLLASSSIDDYGSVDVQYTGP